MAIITNDWKTLNRDVAALQDRGHVVLFQPSAGEIHLRTAACSRSCFPRGAARARLIKVDDGAVTFRYKDYAAANQSQTMTLDALEFLRRFVQHVLPKGFVKIRYYGLLANRQREARLALCRRLLLVVMLEEKLLSVHTAGEVGIEPVLPCRCPHCGSARLVYFELPLAPASARALVRVDSS